jgi:hypothetical protein
MSKAKRLTMPAGCIDVSREMRGTVIALIGDNYGGLFLRRRPSLRRRRPTTSSAPENDAPRRHEGRKKP